jgi:hypothetical protein
MSRFVKQVFPGYNVNSNDFSKVATAVSTRFTPTFFVGAPVLRLRVSLLLDTALRTGYCTGRI